MRVLIISAFFPPLNNIASLRAGAFEKYLRAKGVQVDVVARYYGKQAASGRSMHVYQDASEEMKEPYFRQENIIYTNYDATSSPKKIFQKLPSGVKGLYAYLKIDVYAYGWLKYVLQAFEKELSGNKYDFVIGSYGPPVALLAAKKISDQYKIPLIADYRDIFINEQDRGYHLWLKRKQQAFLLKKAKGILFVSSGMKTFFEKHASSKLRRLPSAIVMNGVNDDMLHQKNEHLENPVVKEFMQIKNRYDLVLLHPGTLYPGQNTSFLMESVNRFNSQGNKKATVVFVGFADDLRDRKPLEGEHVYFLEKVDLATSLFMQSQAHALLLPVWEGRYTGFSGKLLEYLAVQNLVLMGPGMQTDVLDFIKDFKNVIVAENNDMQVNQLQQLASGELQPDKEAGASYEKLRRSYWVDALHTFMQELKEKK